MKKLIILFLTLLAVTTYGQNTDTQNTTQFNVIRNETATGGNTKGRIADAYEALNHSKVSRMEALVTTGTNDYLIAADAAIVSYSNGGKTLQLLVRFANANTGAVRVNINSIALTALVKGNGSAFVGGELTAGQMLWIAYTGSVFQVVDIGITNTSGTNEIPKSNITSFVPSGLFSSTLGNLDLGTGLSGTDRTIAATGSATDVGIKINPKGAAGVHLQNDLFQFGSVAGSATLLVNGTGDFTVFGPDGPSSNGHSIYLKAGDGGTGGGNFNGGSTYLSGGLGSGTGATGNVGFGTSVGSFGGGSKVVFVANAAVNPSTNPTGGFILYGDAGNASHPTIKLPSGTTIDLSLGGITNTAANNEIPKSNATNIIPSGIFSSTLGDLTFGTGLSGTTRTITADGSGADVSLSYAAKGQGGHSFSSGSSGGVGFSYGSSYSISLVGAATSIFRTSKLSGAGSFFISASNGVSGGTAGDDLTLNAGSGYSSGVTNGGNVYISPGSKNSTGLNGNIGLFTSSSGTFGAGEKVLFWADATTNPTTNPTSGGIMFVKSSDHSPYWRTPAGVETSMLGGSGGTVSTVSVVSANGLAGTVANPTTTPAITLSTTVNGLVKGNGTAFSAASAGTDYQAPITLTTTGSGGASSFIGNTINIPDYSTAAVKKRLGDIFNTTLTSGSSSLYTDVSPNTTFTFTSGGLTTSGGNNDAVNYVSYTNYYTNVAYWIERIVFNPTTDGNGLGIGLVSSNGTVLGKIITNTVTNRGQLLIQTLRTGTLLTRSTSISNLSFTTTTDFIELTLERRLMTYVLTARVVDSNGLFTTGNSVIKVEYNDTLLDGSTSTVWYAAQASIHHFGGNQTIKSHYYTVNEFVQNDILLYGNSITAGAFATGENFMFANIIKSSVPGGASLVAGGGNNTAAYILLSPEILALRPKIVIYLDGINDVINSVPLATTQANILTFIRDCHNNNIIPILCTVLPLSSAWSSGFRTDIQTLNSWISGLGYVRTIDLYSQMVSGGLILPALVSTDGLHPNQAGNQLIAKTILTSIRDIVNITNSYNGGDPTIFYDRANSNFGIGSLIPGSSLYVYKSINSSHRGIMINPLNGTLASSFWQAFNDVNNRMEIGISASSAFTPVGNFAANTGILRTSAGPMLITTGGANPIIIETNSIEVARFLANGSLGIGVSPSSVLHLKAGSATANTAPLQLTAGPRETITRAGIFQYDTDASGDNLLTFAPTSTAAKVVALYNVTRATAQTAANASVATWTVGANDGTFLVSANILVTTSTTHSFTATCTYTDEGNTSRTATLHYSKLDGTVVTSIDNAAGAVPYNGVALQIRCKAATTITIATTGTFTTVTYNIGGSISQIN